MSNTSATGGTLTPDSGSLPLEGQALLDFFQAWFVSLTGLAGTLVRPSWQPEPGNLPSNTTDWLAFRIKGRVSDDYAAEIHGNGYNDVQRHQVLQIGLSFYGPNAERYASFIREGVQVAQNREILSVNNMGLVNTGDTVALPELVKDKWYYRVDMQINIRRQLSMRYGVLNLLTADVLLDNEHYTTDIPIQGAP